MIFADYGKLLAYCIVVGLLLPGAWAFRAIKAKPTLVRITVRVFSVLILALTSLLTLLMVGFGGCTTQQAPVYSPDRKRAVVIRDSDGGATGGVASVELYSNFGLYSETLFDGDRKVVQPKDFRWIGNQEVEMKFSYSYGVQNWRSTSQVKVDCHP